MTASITDTDYIRGKYHGDVARNYERDRATEAKYVAELRMVPEWLADVPWGSHILDVPVGTGRFLPTYARLGFSVLGMDVSDDMLAEARKKVTTSTVVVLTEGDVLDTKLPAKSFDVSLCLRLLNRLSPADFVRALVELQRVTRNRIIVNIRTSHRNPRRMRSYEIIQAALVGWHIERDEAEVDNDPGYRMLMLTPA